MTGDEPPTASTGAEGLHKLCVWRDQASATAYTTDGATETDVKPLLGNAEDPDQLNDLEQSIKIENAPDYSAAGALWCKTEADHSMMAPLARRECPSVSASSESSGNGYGPVEVRVKTEPVDEAQLYQNIQNGSDNNFTFLVVKKEPGDDDSTIPDVGKTGDSSINDVSNIKIVSVASVADIENPLSNGSCLNAQISKDQQTIVEQEREDDSYMAACTTNGSLRKNRHTTENNGDVFLEEQPISAETNFQSEKRSKRNNSRSNSKSKTRAQKDATKPASVQKVKNNSRPKANKGTAKKSTNKSSARWAKKSSMFSPFEVFRQLNGPMWQPEVSLARIEPGDPKLKLAEDVGMEMRVSTAENTKNSSVSGDVSEVETNSVDDTEVDIKVDSSRTLSRQELSREFEDKGNRSNKKRRRRTYDNASNDYHDDTMTLSPKARSKVKAGGKRRSPGSQSAERAVRSRSQDAVPPETSCEEYVQCPGCGKLFYTQAYLDKHLAKHDYHGASPPAGTMATGFSPKAKSKLSALARLKGSHHLLELAGEEPPGDSGSTGPTRGSANPGGPPQRPKLPARNVAKKSTGRKPRVSDVRKLSSTIASDVEQKPELETKAKNILRDNLSPSHSATEARVVSKTEKEESVDPGPSPGSGDVKPEPAGEGDGRTLAPYVQRNAAKVASMSFLPSTLIIRDNMVTWRSPYPGQRAARGQKAM